ncbi:hypothetical protein JXA70_04190 [candidate division KSB1 bacterium]|nr:hypothetical protein [candidate division KSB1 bacterium]
MIVKMKKLTILVSMRERLDALKKLRHLGVLHVHAIKSPSSEEIYELQNQLANIEKTAIILKSDDQESREDIDAPELVSKVLELDQRRQTLRAEWIEKREMFKWFESWGKVSFASIEKLKSAGLFIRFYVTDKEGFKKVAPEKHITVVQEGKNLVKFVYFGESKDDTLDLTEQRMPQIEVALLESRIAEIETELDTIDGEIKKLSPNKGVLQPYRLAIEKKLELTTVLHGMSDETQFAYLQGFCPFDKVDEVKSASDTNGWGIIVEDPDDPSQVPTLLRNKKPIRIVQPLFDFMGTFPGYHEMDISFVFLIFFSLFYAMIVGDAGYGLIFLGLTTWARLKFKKAPSEPFTLFFVLSIGTIIWGAITGTWFGSQAISQWPFLNALVIDQIYSFAGTDAAQIFMMNLTFTIGIVHLSVARLMAAAKKLPSPTAIADIGWVLILWCVYFVAKQLVLGQSMPAFALYLLYAGAALVGLFANFQKNILKGFLLSIGNLPLSIISSFSDIVSYIRLFAVGIATVTVASSFNEMANGIVAPLILVLGHGLNIILAMMSVLVHGVRLNMLEFSGQLGQEWSGKEYKPFKE